VQEQQYLARNIPNATFIEIDSNYGHDGFMVESEKISAHLAKWLEAVDR
jgi:homoserine O-acetyltransferase